MNKEQSLTFLDKCLEKVNNSTKEDIIRFKEIYLKNCSETSDFEYFDFCTPILSDMTSEQPYSIHDDIPYTDINNRAYEHFIMSNMTNVIDDKFTYAA